MSTYQEYDVQSRDDGDLEDVVKKAVEKKRKERQQQDDIIIEAHVRDLLDRVKTLLAESAEAATHLLGELHWTLREDADIEAVISPASDALVEADELNLGPAQADQVRSLWRHFKDLRDRGGRHPDPQTEFIVCAAIAKALGYYSSIDDLTPYADVTFERIDEPRNTSVQNPRPVGRRRLKTRAMQDRKDAAPKIPHESCDHIITIAKPRRGKDSTNTSLGMNLWREHGYSYFSLFDDGRMETPMLAIPAEEDVIKESLERLDQSPEPFNAEVYVPAVDAPDKLPANFNEFTISVKDLTPNLILKLAGINSAEFTTEARIQDALKNTVENSGTVSELATKLEHAAGELNSPVSWEEVHSRSDGDGGTETYRAEFSMNADKAVMKAKNRLVQLAGQGLIAGEGATTNIDMEELIAQQEVAKVLCCNFLDQGKESLKFTIIDLWLQLIFEARDRNNRLPRVALELRELKNLAPSKNNISKSAAAKKSLKQTLYVIATQGGSRRVMMLGSTQKLNDIEKSIRQNMATKILLQLGPEEIKTLDKSMNLSNDQKFQLRTFSKGMGMLISENGEYWPIQWRGAPCGLGDGDRHWLDQYAEAYGARVREVQDDYWARKFSDSDWWVHVPDGEVHDMDDPPELENYYSPWYLLEQDFPEGTDPEDLTPELTAEVLESRREHPLKTDIGIEGTFSADLERTISMRPAEEDKLTHQREVAGRFEIPGELRVWLDRNETQIKKMVAVCRVIAKGNLQSQVEVAKAASEELPEGLDYPDGTLSNHITQEHFLQKAVRKSGEYWRLTEAGEEALGVDWPAALHELNELGGEA